MKSTTKILTVLLASLIMNCGGKEKNNEVGYGKKAISETKTETIPASKKIDLTNKGVGPIISVELSTEINTDLVTKGEEIYNKMCIACHRPDKKFIGPAQKGVLQRRTPEWVMNMILNPEGMIQKDPLAKALLAEFNGAPMANQNLTQEEARAVLEYFRTLK